jgi:C4-dicarboxylate-specific signal transduction histidine kinase
VLTVEANSATHELLATQSSVDVSGSIGKFLRDDDDCFLDVIECLFEGRLRFEGTGKLMRSDGTPISVLVAISFPEGGAGYDRVIVGLFDVTQRELTQQALLAAQTEMARASRVATVGALSASLAHELNQPIGALVLNARSCLRWMRRDPPDLRSACEAAERIVRDGHRAAEILKRTRQMVTRNPSSTQALDLGQLIGETCLMLEQELAKTSVVLQTRMPASLPKVKIARPELQQVLVNLLSNGIQAVATEQPEARKLAIECQLEEAATVRISVRDHGPGIKNEHLHMLFDPFFTTKVHGMGIGLSISRSIIEGQGGKLTVSNHEAGGAVFEIRLPVEVQDG